MNNPLFTGKLVRLAAPHADDAKLMALWSADTEYQRLMEVHPVQPHQPTYFVKYIEEDLRPRFYAFAIRVLATDALIGDVMLMGVNHIHGDCYVGIGIGDRAYWGKGYGSDAMNLVLSFAFQELNLRRVSLFALKGNPRAVRSYEKCGFVHEGLVRGAEHRGARDDVVAMGVLRNEWLAKQNDM